MSLDVRHANRLHRSGRTWNPEQRFRTVSNPYRGSRLADRADRRTRRPFSRKLFPIALSRNCASGMGKGERSRNEQLLPGARIANLDGRVRRKQPLRAPITLDCNVGKASAPRADDHAHLPDDQGARQRSRARVVLPARRRRAGGAWVWPCGRAPVAPVARSGRAAGARLSHRWRAAGAHLSPRWRVPLASPARSRRFGSGTSHNPHLPQLSPPRPGRRRS